MYNFWGGKKHLVFASQRKSFSKSKTRGWRGWTKTDTSRLARSPSLTGASREPASISSTVCHGLALTRTCFTQTLPLSYVRPSRPPPTTTILAHTHTHTCIHTPPVSTSLPLKSIPQRHCLAFPTFCLEKEKQNLMKIF